MAASALASYDCQAANARWLDFHEQALAWGRQRPAPRSARPAPTIDVCVTYYQKADYLSQLVDALEQQTESTFHVIAVNDGSPDDRSNQVFEQQARRVAPRGWDFFTQANAFVDAARNAAARRGHGELILFIDADDVPARNAVSRTREAMALCDSDLLICGGFWFASDRRPFDPATGAIEVPAYATCVPFGMDLVGGLINRSVFGGSMFVIRRSVFEQFGGFREIRDAGHEEWELYVRLALAGYKVDVLPDLLQFYRQVEGSLARTLSPDASIRRLLDAYEDGLKPTGLEGSATALLGLYASRDRLQDQVRELSAKADHTTARFAFFDRNGQWIETRPRHIGPLRSAYRRLVSLETRLKVHRIFLQPFLGPVRPPSP